MNKHSETETVDVRILVSYLAEITIPRGTNPSDYAQHVNVPDPTCSAKFADIDLITFELAEINKI